MNDEPTPETKAPPSPTSTSLQANVMSLAYFLKDMKDMGIPWQFGLDVIRIALAFAVTPDDIEKAANAVADAKLKEEERAN